MQGAILGSLRVGRLNGRNAPSLPACALAAADAYLDHLIAIGLAERI